jgi:hypothetical protein
MEQLKNLADDRLCNGCIYCGGPEETRDHVPSRVFLDSPPPDNLPVVWACSTCNHGFSLDEAYVACLIESVIAGSTDPDCIRRPGIASVLRRTPALRARIQAAKSAIGAQIQFNIEPDRIRNVVLKLARGHAAFELSQICRDEPTSLWWYPISMMTDAEREDFEASHVVQMFGEIGSRASQRFMATQITLESLNGETSTMMNLVINDWLDVQEGCYRYLAIDDDGEIKIKIVIAEYLACEVTWAL